MLSPQEEALLAELEAEEAQQRTFAASPSRKPGDLQNPNIQVLSPEEEAMLYELENDFSQRPSYEPLRDKSFLENIGDSAIAVGNAIDSVTGAPTRAAIDATISGKNPLSAFTGQFAEDPNMAPTMKEVAVKLGVDDTAGNYITNPKTGITSKTTKSDADIVGFVGDVAADWTNAIPFAPVAKITGKLKSYLKGSAKAAEVAEESSKVVNSTSKFVPVGETSAVKQAKTSIVKAFRPDVAPDFNKLKEVAESNGINPKLLNSSHEFGEGSVIARHERGVAEGPLGSELIKKNQEFQVAVTDATTNKIKSITKSDGPLNHDSAGELIKESFDQGVDTAIKGMAETFDNALKLSPGMRLNKQSQVILNSDLDKFERWANKRLGKSSRAEAVLNNPVAKKGEVKKATEEMIDALDSDIEAITPEAIAQAKEVLRAVQVAKNAIKRSGGDLGQVRSIMKEIGGIAFNSKKGAAAVPSDIRKFQELYFSTQKAMIESIRSGLGDDFAEELIKNNKSLSELMSNRGKLAPILQGNEGAQVFNKVILSGDKEKIEALKAVISPEAWGKLRASFLDNAISRNSDGLINYKSTRNKLNQLKKQGKIQMFMNMDEINQLDDLLILGERGGNVVLSTSGTGGSNAFRDMLSTVKNQLEGQGIVELQKKAARKRASLKPQTSLKRDNFVEIAPGVEAPKNKSGFQMLREKSPVSVRQGAQGVRSMANEERNKRLELYKKVKGN
jgi:hypothetical protein